LFIFFFPLTPSYFSFCHLISSIFFTFSDSFSIYDQRKFPSEFFILLPCALKKLKRFKVAFAQTASMGQQHKNDARGIFLL
jgi:hypothetical protein